MTTTFPVAAEAIAAHYDDLDRYYRLIWGEHVHHGLWRSGRETAAQAVVALVHEMATRGAIGRGSRVCDAGAGYGAPARLLVDEYGAEVTAFTLSEAQYRYASESPRRRPQLQFHRQNWLENRLPAESFDTVLSIESSEHMEKAPFLQAAHRVLRPQGRLAVAAWLTAGKLAGWEKNHVIDPICVEGRLPELISGAEYCRRIEAAGFRLLDFTDVTKQVRRTWRHCALGVIHRVLTDGEARRFVFGQAENRVFAKSVFRLWAGYYTGTLRYGLFTAEKR